MSKDTNLSQHLPWLIPLLLALLVSFGQLHTLANRVDVIEHQQNTDGKQAVKELTALKERVNSIEHYCCPELD